MKMCTKCQQQKDIVQFSKDQRSKDGFFCHCKECVSKYQGETRSDRRKAELRWRITNPEKVASKSLQYYLTHTKNILEHNKEWRRANPDIYRKCKRQVEARRRARIRGNPNMSVDYNKIIARDDYVVPIAKGGSHAEDNLAMTHPSCNRKKGVKLVEVF